MDAEVETDWEAGHRDEVASEPGNNTVAEPPARPAPYTAGAGGAGGRTRTLQGLTLSQNGHRTWPFGGETKDRPTGDPSPSRSIPLPEGPRPQDRPADLTVVRITTPKAPGRMEG